MMTKNFRHELLLEDTENDGTTRTTKFRSHEQVLSNTMDAGEMLPGDEERCFVNTFPLATKEDNVR